MSGLRALVVGCLLLGGVGAAGAEPDRSLLRRDFAQLLTAARLRWVVAGMGVAGFAHQWDEKVKGEVGGGLVERVLETADYYGSSTGGLAATSAAWGATRLVRWQEAQAVFSDMLRALILARAVVMPLKFTVGRKRPDGSNRLSFPSGHSANAFALTTVLHRRYGWKVGGPLYAFTALVPAARIHKGRHFFSDVVGGAVLGAVVGTAVNRSPAGGAHLGWIPAGGARGGILQVRWIY